MTNSQDRSSRRPSGSRPRRSSDPFKFLGEDGPAFLAEILASFAPGDGPGLSAFDFNPDRFTPLSEILHEGNDVVVRLELPGVDPKNVSVMLTASRLVVSGEKTEEKREEGTTKKLREVRYGSFKRTYPMPTKVQAADISASYKDGVLSVRVKDALSQDEGIKINVE